MSEYTVANSARPLPLGWAIFMCALLWSATLFGSYRFLSLPRSCAEFTESPYDISAPGCYRLGADIELDNDNTTAVIIRSNNVKLDLGGHALRSRMDPDGRSNGIMVFGGKNVSIENGIIEGFLYGVRVEAAGGKRRTENTLIRNIRLEGNLFRGAAIDGAFTRIQNVTVHNTGGTTLFKDASVRGLELSGPACEIIDNKVDATHAPGRGEAVGIALLDDADGCIVERNVLLNNPGAEGGATAGIWSRKNYRSVRISENKLTGFDNPILLFETPSLPTVP